MTPGVSIIVLTYKNRFAIERMFNSYFEHQTNIPHEFIIVLNNATQEIKDSVKDIKERLENIDVDASIIDLPENRGVSGGRNVGMKEASGDYLLFLDDDVVITSSNWLTNMLDYFTKTVYHLVSFQRRS